MAFTKTELETAIKDFTENTETSFVNNLPLFISTAEDRIMSSVDLEFFRKNVTTQVTANSQYLPTPSDFLAPFSFQITDTGKENFLLEKDVNFIREAYPSYTSYALPEYYARFDVGNFILGPTPDQAYNIELHYFYRPVSLTAQAATGTTWLSTNASNALLYGSLIEAYIYMKGEQDVIALYEGRFNTALDRLKDLAEARENRDAYRDGLPRRPRT